MTARLRAMAVLAGIGMMCAAVAGCQAAPPVDRTVTMALPGRTNQTPNLAADGRIVAVSWTAFGENGLADAYVAVSRDAGATFGPPVRVNDVAGEVRPSEQQSPRIAMAAGALAVLWTSRRESETQIRIAVSTDEGRSFGASRQISPAGAPGTRGWGSLLVDDERRVHVLWLDTRESAGRTSAAGRSGEPHAAHMHGAEAKPETRQDVYEAIVSDGTIDERVVATGVCFCCKTALVKQGDAVWGAWRDVYPGSLRDISFARLDRGDGDDPERVRVSEDNWKIEGCPEDGPSLSAVPGQTDVVWPTLVSSDPMTKGVFHASTRDGRAFSARVRLDAGAGSASHPSIAAGAGGVRLAVWEVTERAGRRIEARRLTGGDWLPVEVIAPGPAVSSPAVAALADAFVVAWGRRAGSETTIEVRRVSAR